MQCCRYASPLCALPGAAPAAGGEQRRAGPAGHSQPQPKLSMRAPRRHRAAPKAGRPAAGPAAAAAPTTQVDNLPDYVLGLIFSLAGGASGCAVLWLAPPCAVPKPRARLSATGRCVGACNAPKWRAEVTARPAAPPLWCPCPCIPAALFDCMPSLHTAHMRTASPCTRLHFQTIHRHGQPALAPRVAHRAGGVAQVCTAARKATGGSSPAGILGAARRGGLALAATQQCGR